MKIHHSPNEKPGNRADGTFSGRRSPSQTMLGMDRATQAFDQTVQELEIQSLLEEMELLGRQLFRFPSAQLLQRYRSTVGALLHHVEQGLRLRKDFRWRRTDRSSFVLVERAERALSEIEDVLAREGERTKLLELLDEVKGCLISLLL